MFGTQRDVVRSSGNSHTGFDDGNGGEGECDPFDHRRIPCSTAEAESSETVEDGFVSCMNERVKVMNRRSAVCASQ